MIILLIVIISLVGIVGIKFFYLVPENAHQRAEKVSIWQTFSERWTNLTLGARAWGWLKSAPALILQQRLLAVVLLVVSISVVLTLAMGGRHWLERPSASEIQFASNASLALADEKLVPPPPLPPSVFLGSERLALESADRDWSKLQPTFRQTLLLLLARMSTRGYDFALLEGYRSPQRQDTLAALGAHLTGARAYESRHQYGLAADLAPIRNGVLAFNFEDPWAKSAYIALGEEARNLGLVWGGGWKLQDYGHIELR